MQRIIPKIKRYYQFSEYLKERFGCKVYKVTIDAGFTCPNRDGSLGWGGCSYCNNLGFSANTRLSPRPIREQVEQGMAFMRERYKADKFIAYFQAYTNTYAPIETLRAYYDEALAFEDIVGLSIGTRPDCVPEPVLDLIENYQAATREVWVEYGLQSIHDSTLKRVNRGHDYAAFLDALERTGRRSLKVCVHVILGLPGESHDDMMATARALAQMDIDSVKIHLMHVLRDTPMEKELLEGRFKTLEFEEYVSLVCDFLEYIPSHISIQRLTADGPRAVLLAPTWATQKRKIIAAIDAELERRNSHQGIKAE
ncbi:MAG: TIGR01212 family radical SAM protein [Candidatus Abyssobacteria bacterium SURF_17]|uniref:TIGR01212 family radical SAM protein n=1 Tax=Candidatus Abyssobacteria bacterium SURF_17 TaxID=2093361 RepID=A0A419F9G1_9BACT|nr:MAG: TIGR01212 family radical SAM protein [Candidatus Abyssubacteria bacterium SURF_17]